MMKIGDRVKISQESQWYDPKEDYLKVSNPTDVLGTVTEILNVLVDDLCIDVTWDTFYENGDPIVNSYAENDLEVVK